MLRSLTLLMFALMLAWPAQARTLQASIQQVESPMARMQQVRLRLHWPAQAPQGQLELHAARLDSEALGYAWRDVRWHCPLQRDGASHWRCEGPVRSAGQAPARLALRLGNEVIQGSLQQGGARVTVDHVRSRPELVGIDLVEVPALWLQALARQGWSDVGFSSGKVDGQLRVHLPQKAPWWLDGELRLAGLGLANADASIAAENLGVRLQLQYRNLAGRPDVRVQGQWRGGEFLAGNTYVALPSTPITFNLRAQQVGSDWQLSQLRWQDGDVLQASGSARVAADASLRALDLEVASHDMRPLAERYLSGPLGQFGLERTGMAGQARAHLKFHDGQWRAVDARLQQVELSDPDGRFGFNGLDGNIVFSADGAPVQSELRWQGSRVYGLQFGAARMPLQSAMGELRLREAVEIPLFGGSFRIHDLGLRPPRGGAPFSAEFAMELEDVDFGSMAGALGLPAFGGTLNGYLPRARYANDVLQFDGGLSMALLDGTVQFSALSLERPFGSAPSLNADIDLRGIDMAKLTAVLDIGGISGRLDGRIHGLRLVNWTPVAFDAWLYSVPQPGLRQRISQRAVQDISSVGDASFVGSLQGQLIGLFEDFGYRRIGIGCRLANQVCEMSGLRSDANSFTIVEGSGLPHLSVVGYNRRVDWPTLVQRLVAAGKGEVSPVVE